MGWWPMVRTALTRRWRSGQAVKVLSREMRRHPSTVRDPLKRTGGIRSDPRRRWKLRLSLAEQEEISRGLAAGESLRAIAGGLGRAPSTVSREVAGNGGRAGYRALAADRAAWARAARPKQTKLARWPGPAGNGRGQAGVVLVAGADRRVAAATVPDRDSDARVARDHLPLAVRAGPRGPAARADSPPAHEAGDAPTAAPGCPTAWAAAQHPQHLRMAGRGRGSSGARALGG